MEPVSSTEEKKKRMHKKIAIAVIAAAAMILYLPALTADFVYDDISQIIIDDYIHKPANLVQVLTLSSMRKDIIDNNRPVMLLSLMIDSLLWARNPFGYHLTNLVIHALNSVLMFLILYGVLFRLFPQSSKTAGVLWGAFAGAVLFAIHPVNSEAVCVISFREDLLVTFFMLLVLILAQRFPSSKSSVNLIIGSAITILIFMAAAAKENGVVIPLFLFVYWIIVRRCEQWRLWTGLICSGFVATAVFTIARFKLVPTQSEIFVKKAVYLGGSFSNMLMIQPRIWAYQLLELFWPKLLCADYTGYSVRHISLAVSIVILAAAVIIVSVISRKNKAVGVGAIFYCLAILPVSNFVPMFKPMADRYLYLPMAGVCLALAAVVCRIRMPTNRGLWVMVTVGAMALVFLCTYTIRQILLWHDSISIWQDTVNKNPYSYTGYDGLGFALFDAGRFKEALSCFKRASELKPNGAEQLAQLAITYESMDMPADAEEAYRKAVSLDNSFRDNKSIMKKVIWKSNQAEILQKISDRVQVEQKSGIKKP